MVIVETPIFTKIITSLLDDDEYKELQEALVMRPTSGALIRNSGGLRKLRWSLKNTGKSGGIRVIYYWMTENSQIYMLYAYPKNTRDNISDAQLAKLKDIVERWS